MELRRLRYFVAVAEELHFSRAAERLHISQAPLSAQIRKLEHEVDYQLLDRTTRSVSLTPVGEEFYRRALDLLSDADDLTDDLELIEHGEAGTLRVGFSSSASYELLPRALREFRARAPKVRLILEPGTSSEQAAALRDGSLDLGIVRGEHGAPGLPTRRLFSEDIVACLPADHPLAAADRVTPGDLSTEPLISFPSREMPGYASEIRPIFARTAFPPVYTRIVQQETALGLVAAGLGYTLLPASVSAFAPDTVRVVGITGSPETLMCAALPDAEPGLAVTHFLDVLDDVSRTL